MMPAQGEFHYWQHMFIEIYGPVIAWQLVVLAALSILAAIGYIWASFLRWLTRRTPE